MFPPYLFAYAETLRVEPAVIALRAAARRHGATLWIAGGTLRDTLLTRWPKDLDLAVDGDPNVLGREVAAEVGGTFVPLDPATGTVRVAIRGTQGIDWLDMSRLRAPDIEGDLARRDFTINAIALPLDETFDDATGVLLDPLGGRDDLHQRRVRLTGPEALSDDPLRLLRGYRLAGQLGFTLDADTRREFQAHAALIRSPSVERVVAEMSQLLTSADPAAGLSPAMEDGVLGHLFPALAAGVDMTQNAYHHLDVWPHTLAVVQEMTRIASGTDLSLPFAVAEDRVALGWAALFHDVAKPTTRSEDDKGVHFLGHDVRGAEMFAQIATQYRLPKKLSRQVTRLIRHHLRPLMLLSGGGADTVTARAADRLLRDLEGDLDGLFRLAFADLRASQGPARPDNQEADLGTLYQRLRRHQEECITPVDDGPPLLTGGDLIQRFGVAPGPRIGRLLKALRTARIDGTVGTREDAEKWLAARLVDPPPADR